MGVPNAFALFVNFIRANWEPKHVTIDLFETTKTIRQIITLKHQALLDKYDLKKTIFCLCEKGSVTSIAMTIALKLKLVVKAWG
jgi:hypothetical protein